MCGVERQQILISLVKKEMQSHVKINIKDFRAVKQAEIVLDGITVIAGENGSGKSTISKLVYHLLKTSIEFEKIVDRNTKRELTEIIQILDNLIVELNFLINRTESKTVEESLWKIRQFLRSFLSSVEFKLSENEAILQVLNTLIELFEKEELKFDRPLVYSRLKRIQYVLNEIIPQNGFSDGTDITILLKKLKENVQEILSLADELKKKRPLKIFYESIEDIFYGTKLDGTFNLVEHNVSIVDRKNNTLIPLHSVEKVAYIDTPMIVGVELFGDSDHWNDLNSNLRQKGKNTYRDNINKIFSKEVLKGEVKFVHDHLAPQEFIYQREDGMEFDLLDCATGLKSFAILRLLYNNGFLTKKTLLIIDEPEAHLHPQWVVEYARLVVLLHKKIGVKFLIASHHPDMISAIKYISEKEIADQNLHFYMAEKGKNPFLYTYKNLGTEIEKIFESFNVAFSRIDLYGKTE